MALGAGQGGGSFPQARLVVDDVAVAVLGELVVGDLEPVDAAGEGRIELFARQIGDRGAAERGEICRRRRGRR
jgi:hypothetical protein